jgi:hypothetical protein
MIFSPIEHTASLRIGSVEFVSPDEIKVCLDIEAPEGVSANAGVPRAFPRINSYVLIATEAGYIVAQIEWIAIEKTPFPKRKGFQDYGLVDLPFPTRKMRANPLGLLKATIADKFEFQRGVQSFPSIGEPVLIPTDSQLKSIVESGANRRIKIGTSPVAANAEVKVDPDRLFGRHLAVLGNTGSGKSCSVAGLIQWSLTEAEKSKRPPNARFIIIDPNGEYSRVFCTEESKHKARLFKVDDQTLKVPLWFWNSSEWRSFAQASAKSQAPLLRQGLRAMRNEEFEVSAPVDFLAKRFVGTLLVSLKHDANTGTPWAGFPKSKGFFEKCQKWAESIQYYLTKIKSAELTDLSAKLNAFLAPRSRQHACVDASVPEINTLVDCASACYLALGGELSEQLPVHEDVPSAFPAEAFVNYLDVLAQEQGIETYVDYMLTRIRTLLSDSKMAEIIGDTSSHLNAWLESFIGANCASNGCVAVIDLSLVPAEIVHIVTSVIARMTFEALQRYRKLEHGSFPTVLVMEEAHTFIKRYKEDAENEDAATVCCRIFEKIAREGRKFGLGLVLSSQRPSELSPTVLSQCNSFLLHRISNDEDQKLVSRLVPDNLRGLLRELPSLPSQNAILLGWASELPVMVRMNDLSEHERPHSEDPDFWNVWTGKDNDGKSVERNVDWKKIADDWQGKAKQTTPVTKKNAKKP